MKCRRACKGEREVPRRAAPREWSSPGSRSRGRCPDSWLPTACGGRGRRPCCPTARTCTTGTRTRPRSSTSAAWRSTTIGAACRRWLCPSVYGKGRVSVYYTLILSLCRTLLLTKEREEAVGALGAGAWSAYAVKAAPWQGGLRHALWVPRSCAAPARALACKPRRAAPRLLRRPGP